MNGCLIFSIKKTLELLSKKKYFFNNKNNIYLTDKIIIYNLLKSKKIKVVCLDSLIKGQETVMNWADPEMNRYVGQKYFGGKKTKHRRNRKGNKSRRK